MDAQAAALLGEALHVLQRGFSTGNGGVEDCPETVEVLKQLHHTLEIEEALEARMGIWEGTAARREDAFGGAANDGGKSVCCLVDGSSNSYAALRWALEHVVDPQDDVFLLTVNPFEEYGVSTAERILTEAFEYAHNAGVRAARLHPRSLEARSSSRTRGVGESVRSFVEGFKIGLLVVGSRGLGSVKRSLLGSLGMGSVSDYCLHNLQCPVLVVKEGQAEAEQALEREEQALAQQEEVQPGEQQGQRPGENEG